MAPKIVDRKHRREEILRAAMGVFASQGVYDFKIADIAEAAGIGKGTVYEYFRSKQELVDGCLALFMTDYIGYINRQVAAMESPEGQVRAMIRASLEYLEINPEKLNLIFDFWIYSYRQSDRELLRCMAADTFEPAMTMLISLIRRGIEQGVFRSVDPRMTAAMLWGMLDGLLFQLASGMSTISSNDADLIADTFIRGLRS